MIGYNLPRGVRRVGSQYVTSTPADVAKGGGIFLHVNGKGATAGCVSVSLTDLRSVMRRLDPAQRPLIVMGPASVLPKL